MSLELAGQVADAVLYEGYVLYPYRASAQKNQMRWQFGVLVPRDHSEHAGEAWAAQAEVLVDPAPATEVRVRARGLQLERRTGDVPWDEGIEQSVETCISLAGGSTVTVPFVLPAIRTIDGDTVRTRQEIACELVVTAEPLPGPYGVVKVRARLENRTAWHEAGAPRDDALQRAIVGAHLLLALEGGGRFVSLVDPPQWAQAYVEECEQLGLWPVLVGPGDDVVLAPPIILEERPQIAPESPGQLYDGTEIDEILSLRTLTLTVEEKAEARATDPRAAAVIDRVEAMPAEELARLHGAVRRPAPPAVGARVRLRPRAGADAQDMFLEGRVATVEAVLADVDGEQHVAVVLDDDPGADVKRAQGRFLYFKPDEVAPL